MEDFDKNPKWENQKKKREREFFSVYWLLKRKMRPSFSSFY